jgi:hypothetical protein
VPAVCVVNDQCNRRLLTDTSLCCCCCCTCVHIQHGVALHLQLLNSLSQQLAGVPLAASPGSVHCLLLQLLPTAKTAEPTPMGRLKLSWKRRTPAQPSNSSGSSGSSSASTATAVAAVAAMQAAPAPSQDVEAMLELPAVVVQESLLSVKAHGPQHVTAGTSFPFTLQVRKCVL